jgi:MYXO-CTERM domain-containing protein
MRSEHVLVTALLTTAALALAPTEAHAFCRTTTVATPANFDPGGTPEGCFAEGHPLFHQSQCIAYQLLAGGSERIPTAVLSNAIARAFATWTAPNASCAPGISGIELAPVTGEPIAEYKIGQRGHNVFGVVPGPWPHAGGGDTLSLATLTFAADTGQVYDADLEIREDVAWYAGADPGLPDKPPADAYDLQAVMTHEVGHVLGLAHSNHADAAMFAAYAPGSTAQRKLAADDAAGVCAIYPTRQTRSVSGNKLIPASACDLSSSAGSSGSACGDPVVAHGCGVGSTGPSRDGAWLAGLGILGALAWRSRRRLQRA